MELTQERLQELLHYDPDTGNFYWKLRKGGLKSAGDIAGGTVGEGYRQIGIDRRYYKSHRLAWLYVHGVWPANCIDHINGNRTDNRIANLRAVTNQENCFNVTVVRAASGYMGVYLDKKTKTFVAAIRVNGRTKTLGRHKTPEAAHEAYQKAKRELHVIPS